MSRSSGSADTWVDPAVGLTGLPDSEWVDPVPPLSTASFDVDGPVVLPDDSLHPTDAYELPGFAMDDAGGEAWTPGEEWRGPAPEAACTHAEACEELAGYLVEKYNSGKWPATDVCKLSYWATMGGMTGSLAALAKRPGLPTGHYNHHIKKVLGISDDDDTFEYLDMPCSDSGDGSRINYKLAVIPPHEMLNKEMSENRLELDSLLAQHVRDDMVPKVYKDHIVTRASGKKAQPIAIYLDAVPTTKKDAVLGVWVYFAMSSKRHLCCVLRKSRMCQCGCRHWCSLFVLFSWLNWSLMAAAAGEQPSVSWDNREYTMANDFIRSSTAGSLLLYIGCVCVIKGDWAEFCNTFGFSTWTTKIAPCYGCWATKDNYLDDQSFSKGHACWPDFTMQDYLDACNQCEHDVVVHTLA